MADAASAEIVKDMLEGLRQELGVHALKGAEAAGFQQRRERSMAAMMVLIFAAKEVATSIGLLEMYTAICAGEVPATVLQGRLN